MGSEKVIDAVGPGVNFDHPAATHPIILDHDAPKIDWRGRKKCAIVGFATSSRDFAPFNDPEYVIIALNQLYRHIPRADAWFEIHSNWNEHVVEGTDHFGWLKAAPIPIFMTERVPGIPNAVRYPKELLETTFGPYKFTSSVAYMLALAILERFEEIAIYGIDLVVGDEYFYQKACVEYLIGYANAKGITVRLPKQTALCKGSHWYGYELEPDTGPLKLSVLQARVQELQKKRREMLNEVYVLEGAINEAGRWHEYIELTLRGADLEHVNAKP